MIGVVAARPEEAAHAEAMTRAILAGHSAYLLRVSKLRAGAVLEAAAIAYAAAVHTSAGAEVAATLATEAVDAAADAMVAAGLPDPRQVAP